MKTITREGLRQILSRTSHSTFIGITSLTPVKTLGGATAPVIKKLSRINLCVGSYSAAVTRQRVRENGDAVEPFVPKPRKWGQIYPGSLALVVHTPKDSEPGTPPKFYLSGQVLKAKSPIYLQQFPPLRKGRKERLIGVEKEAIAQYLPAERSPAEAQGVEKAVIHRDISLENISCVAMNGESYKVID